MASLVPGDRLFRKAIGYSLGFALLWTALALVRPSTTYHLVPLLVAAVAPAVYRIRDGKSRSTGLRLAFLAVGMAALAAILLGVAGLLDGPSLLPVGDAVLESLLGAIVGGAVGLAVAAWPRPAETI